MNLGRLFDSPAQLLIIVLVIVLLFGATRLPNAARQLGRSMRIFKSEIKEMKNDGNDGKDARDSRTSSDDLAAQDRDVTRTPPAPEPLEGRVMREEHAPRTTQPESSASADGARRDS